MRWSILGLSEGERLSKGRGSFLVLSRPHENLPLVHEDRNATARLLLILLRLDLFAQVLHQRLALGAVRVHRQGIPQNAHRFIELTLLLERSRVFQGPRDDRVDLLLLGGPLGLSRELTKGPEILEITGGFGDRREALLGAQCLQSCVVLTQVVLTDPQLEIGMIVDEVHSGRTKLNAGTPPLP